uniref:acylglycerol lipase n=1 Tax=Pseudonaja textilis TaxID=8673 RepID=A0A670YSY4_PSETE
MEVIPRYGSFTNSPSLSHSVLHIFRTKRLKMGVKVKYLYNEGYQFSYFTRGEPGSRPSVLMLHGFSLNKDMWLNTIEVFPKDLHLVCLDLPGHGGTTCLLGESYTAVAQAKRVHQFVQCAGLNHKPFHLVGMSMGGMVAGVYAALYPAHISSLALFCPAGVRYLTDSEFFAQLHELIFSKGSVENAIIPVTEEHLENFVKLKLKNRSKQIPWQVSLLMKNGGERKNQTNSVSFLLEQGFLDLTSSESRYSLHENMRKIKAPTQIIWGKEDKVRGLCMSGVLCALEGEEKGKLCFLSSSWAEVELK